MNTSSTGISHHAINRCKLIAEIGVNHCGDIALARRMILAAKECGADAVKFQTFSAKKLATKKALKVPYQLQFGSVDESHFEMLEKLELTYKAHELLYEFCSNANIEFLSTPYDVDSAKFLVSLGCNLIKTASADIVDIPLHEYIASTGLKVFIATGMATLFEIESCLNIYGPKNLQNVTLLHCVSNYPCSDQSLNLRAIETLRNRFNCDVGFSDHSVGNEAALISRALGATVIEKHFTTDKSLPGPDQSASANPDEFGNLVKLVRRGEIMLGGAEKFCQPEELQMSLTSRKSLTLNRSLSAGSVIRREDLTLKRPGTGIYYADIDKVVGAKVNKDLDCDSQPTWEDLF
jgi:N,N'-diacetyllegionaminate synthase